LKELSNRLKKQITEDEYKNRILLVCFERQLRFSKIGKLVLKDEFKYYKLLEEHCRRKMHLFPYHLQERLIGMQITPFIYYIGLLADNLNTEKSYDQLPNFTAADILRLTEIGRNQYISLLNETKPKNSISRMIFRRSNSLSSASSKLPSKIRKLQLKDWWLLRPGFPTEQNVSQLGLEAKTLLDQLIENDNVFVKDANIDTIHELYNNGLIYFKIPISSTDRFRVKILDGFVMNRLSGDYVETILYKVFSTLSSSSSVSNLCELLGDEEEIIKGAISTLNRFGFIEKYTEIDMELNEIPSGSDNDDFQIPSSPTPAEKGIALIYDAGLAALLMMGNLSVGLKKHAVSMFEVGRLEHDQIESLISELRNIDEGESGAEGEAQMYFDQGRSLLLALELLRVHSKVDMIKAEALSELSEDVVRKILKAKYKKIIAIAELSCQIPQPDEVPLVGNPNGQSPTPWIKMLLAKINSKNGFPVLILPRGHRLKELPETFCNKNFRKMKICSWNTNESQLIDYSISIYNLNELLLNIPLLIYMPSNEQSIRVPLPTTRDNLKKYIDDDFILDEFETIANITETFGFVELMKYDEKYFFESISFGLPLSSLSLTGTVADAIISDSASGNATFSQWTSAINQLCVTYGDTLNSSAWPSKPILIQNGQFNLL